VFFASHWITSGSIMDQNITYKTRKYHNDINLKFFPITARV